MILYMDPYKAQETKLLKEVHEKVKEALDHEPIEVRNIEEATAWLALSDLEIALDKMFPERRQP